MTSKNPNDYIQPMHINGLEGRLLIAPADSVDNKRQILLMYGHHALLERWWGLVQNLTEFGTVTMPDLPGFGGMDSFERIGHEPTIDQFADYLAAFVKMRYNRRRFTIVAISFGFIVATRMLQKYPELAKKVDLVVSLVGFMNRDDFLMKPAKRKLAMRFSRMLSHGLFPGFIKHFILTGPVIRNLYIRTPNGKRRLLSMPVKDKEKLLQLEVQLWKINDVKTHWRTTSEFLDIDLCTSQLPMPVWHVAASGDHYFDNAIVEQHMRIVFERYNQSVMDTPAHTPSIIGGKKELGIMIPPELRKHLKML